MTPSKSKTKRRCAALEGESSVYDGTRLLGEIKPSGKMFNARSVAGKRIGAFATSLEAMRAICRADEAARRAEVARA